MMENHSKCAECVRRGRPCVGASWESLDRTREKLESDLDIAEEELAQALAKEARKKRHLKRTKSKLAEKALCLAQEFADDNDGVFEGDSNASFFENLSSEFWQSLTFSNAEIPSGAVGSSQGFQ